MFVKKKYPIDLSFKVGVDLSLMLLEGKSFHSKRTSFDKNAQLDTNSNGWWRPRFNGTLFRMKFLKPMKDTNFTTQFKI